MTHQQEDTYLMPIGVFSRPWLAWGKAALQDAPFQVFLICIEWLIGIEALRAQVLGRDGGVLLPHDPPPVRPSAAKTSR